MNFDNVARELIKQAGITVEKAEECLKDLDKMLENKKSYDTIVYLFVLIGLIEDKINESLSVNEAKEVMKSLVGLILESDLQSKKINFNLN